MPSQPIRELLHQQQLLRRHILPCLNAGEAPRALIAVQWQVEDIKSIRLTIFIQRRDIYQHNVPALSCGALQILLLNQSRRRQLGRAVRRPSPKIAVTSSQSFNAGMDLLHTTLPWELIRRTFSTSIPRLP